MDTRRSPAASDWLSWRSPLPFLVVSSAGLLVAIAGTNRYLPWLYAAGAVLGAASAGAIVPVVGRRAVTTGLSALLAAIIVATSILVPWRAVDHYATLAGNPDVVRVVDGAFGGSVLAMTAHDDVVAVETPTAIARFDAQSGRQLERIPLDPDAGRYALPGERTLLATPMSLSLALMTSGSVRPIVTERPASSRVVGAAEAGGALTIAETDCGENAGSRSCRVTGLDASGSTRWEADARAVTATPALFEHDIPMLPVGLILQVDASGNRAVLDVATGEAMPLGPDVEQAILTDRGTLVSLRDPRSGACSLRLLDVNGTERWAQSGVGCLAAGSQVGGLLYARVVASHMSLVAIDLDTGSVVEFAGADASGPVRADQISPSLAVLRTGDAMTAFDPTTGQRRWRVSIIDREGDVARVIVTGKNAVLIDRMPSSANPLESRAQRTEQVSIRMLNGKTGAIMISATLTGERLAGAIVTAGQVIVALDGGRLVWVR